MFFFRLRREGGTEAKGKVVKNVVLVALRRREEGPNVFTVAGTRFVTRAKDNLWRASIRRGRLKTRSA